MQLDHVRIRAHRRVRKAWDGVEIVARRSLVTTLSDQLLPARTFAGQEKCLPVAMGPCFCEHAKPSLDIGVRPGMEEARIGHIHQALLPKRAFNGKDTDLRPERIAVPKGGQPACRSLVVEVTDSFGHHEEVILAPVPLPRLEALQVLLDQLNVAAGLFLPKCFVLHAVKQHRERQWYEEQVRFGRIRFAAVGVDVPMDEPIQTKLPGVEDAHAGNGPVKIAHAKVGEVVAHVLPVVRDLDRAAGYAG
eukprot:scaffold1308_cov247-Pinguiococcus_pyrenoidosus.AAC.6